MGDPVIFREYKAYGEGPCNIGDLFVEEGARRLLSISGLDPEDGNTLFVIGTPWLWNLCWESPKYQHLVRLMEERKFKRKIALGIGSCFGWNGRIDLSLNARRVVDLWRGFDLVVCRDEIAKSLIPDSICLPCPSLWFMDKAPCTPTQGILQINCLPWHPDYSEDNGWINPTLPILSYDNGLYRNREDLIRFLSFVLSHEKVVSKRIHAILPASPFIQTRCVPSDSRAMSCRKAMIPIHPEGQWSQPEVILSKRNGEWLMEYGTALQAFG